MINNFTDKWILENRLFIKDFIFNMDTDKVDVGEHFTIINRNSSTSGQYLMVSYVGLLSNNAVCTKFICKSDDSNSELGRIKYTYSDLYSYVTSKKRQKIIDEIL